MSEEVENRRDARRCVYLGEGIKVYIKDLDEVRSIQGEITDISPWGCNIYIADQKLASYPKKGDTIKLYYNTREKKTFTCKGRVIYVISKVIDDIKYLRYGIEIINEYILNPEVANIKYYEIPDIFTPHCWCGDAFFFQEKIIFKVKSLHSNGMILITSARNKTLLPNLDLQLKVSIPALDEFIVNTKIAQVINSTKPNEKDKYYVHVIFENKNTKFLQVFVEYILFCGVEVTPKELRENNLPVDIIENSLSHYYAMDKFDLEKIYELRKIGLFEEIPKIISDSVVENENTESDHPFKDKFDEYSRQLICKVGKKPIACLRIIFNNQNQEKTELYEFCENIPDWLLTKKFVEISRFAWDKEYRESDVFINMIRQVVRIVIESGHTHIVTSSPEPLIPLYTKVGFQVLDVPWKSKYSTIKSKESILFLDAKGILSGEIVIEKFIWNKIYSRVANYLGITTKE
ncbi:GNAT family N-acyltransferase [Pigmentibacter sp. JX0631]|uniref:N-acyl amino acid synthase FeeM domain-containing protein n=1 Tax=Pigmentibacter sp. JX0631 TaxID=2976982 RepID=UPI002468B727|nr:GNAT family N-acyltransferase [Pigmentibacter sp. JX0631]WGL59163.1 GNAT family N-acyltransferase [Pigmentibacter sp. JX0631]